MHIDSHDFMSSVEGKNISIIWKLSGRKKKTPILGHHCFARRRAWSVCDWVGNLDITFNWGPSLQLLFLETNYFGFLSSRKCNRVYVCRRCRLLLSFQVVGIVVVGLLLILNGPP